MQLRKKAAAVLAAATLFSGLGVLTASTASAAQPCDPTQFVNNSSAYGKLKGTYNLKYSPASECGNVASVPSGKGFYVWCYVKNYYGNKWFYGRVEGTSTYGWLSADNVAVERGSQYPC
ncbi:hypothetical protein [Kitasatospora sp. NPDC002040]|uniref:hypothetical protein n=1 Tax=Kitasatospora sp. NPDC002040 TaxID=3154661 RepID=UPI00332571F2